MRKFTIIWVILIAFSTFSTSQDLQWLSQAADTITGRSYYISVTTDQQSNIYCAGIRKGDDSDDEDGRFFASKRSPDGTLLWEKTYEEAFINGNGEFDEIVYSVRMAQFNRVLIAGEANNKSKLLTINRNTGELFNDTEITGGPNKVVALGVPRTINQVPNGPCYVVGYFRGEIQLPGQFNPVTLASSDGTDIFIGKWNGTSFSEVIHISGPDDQVPFDIEITPNKQLYLSYLTKESVWLNQQQILATNNLGGNFSGFLLKLNVNSNTGFDFVYNKRVVLGESQILLQQPTHLSGGNAGGGDELVKFPISIDELNDKVYFYYNRKSNQSSSQEKIISRVNAITGDIQSTHYVNLYNSNNERLWIEDIAVSNCDSLYVIANEWYQIGGITEPSFANGSSTTHLLTLNTSSLTKTMQISSFPGYHKAEELFIDRDGKVGFCGFYGNGQVLFGEIGLGSDTYYDRGFVAKYVPCQGTALKTAMITGPAIVCPDNYPISWPFSPPGNTSDCQLVIEATSENHPNPLSVINYSTPTSSNPVFTINDLNGYSYPIKIRYECIQNCCEKIYDERVVLPALELQPAIEPLNITETGGNLTVTAGSVNLSTPNIVFLWQLYEGEIISNGDNFDIIIKNEGTAQEVLVYEEYDAINNDEEAEYSYSNLENKPYVIKLGVYYQEPDGTTCGWYETRKGFLIDSPGNLSVSGNNITPRTKKPGLKKKEK